MHLPYKDAGKENTGHRAKAELSEFQAAYPVAQRKRQKDGKFRILLKRFNDPFHVLLLSHKLSS
jgi:hypothetical protein